MECDNGKKSEKQLQREAQELLNKYLLRQADLFKRQYEAYIERIIENVIEDLLK